MASRSNLENLSQGVLIRAIDSTTSPLIITDNQQDDNPIIYANKAFLDLCGYSEKEILGKNCRFLQGSDSEKAAIQSIRRAVDTGKDTRVTLKNYRKDGSVFWNDLVISPIVDEKGKTTHFIGMQLDITERVAYAHKLEAIQEKLTKSNEELEQFTYAASHDLQEPLRMVSSYLQLLDRRYGSAFDDDAKVFIDFAVEGAERMQALINDLLTLSRVSSTAKRFKAVDFNEVIKNARFNLKLQIEETKTVIEVGTMPTIDIDSLQMVQMMQNLIGNAIKYRKPGRAPKISISAKKVADCYEFTVADNGIGIEDQYYKRIFTIFQRLHTREEYPGTGVGLAICTKIVERHNGKLWVESNKTGGSSFMFKLPIKRKAK